MRRGVMVAVVIALVAGLVSASPVHQKFRMVVQEGAGALIGFSPDSMLMLALDGQKVQVFRVADGSLLRTFREHTETVLNASFTADGKTIASVTKDKLLYLWRLDDGALVKKVTLPAEPQAVVFSADRSIAAVAYYPDQISVYLLRDGSEVTSFRNAGGGLQMMLSNDTVVVFNTETSLLSLFDFRKQKPRSAITLARFDMPVGMSADGSLLACFSDIGGRTLALYEMKTGKPLWRHAVPSFASHVLFSPDGSSMASNADDGIDIWNTRDGSHRGTRVGAMTGVKEFEARAKFIGRLAWSPDGRYLAGGAYLWRTDRWELMHSLLENRLTLGGVWASPDGSLVAVSTAWTGGPREGRVYVIRPDDLTLAAVLPTRVGYVGFARFSPSGRKLAVLSDPLSDAGLYDFTIWDTRTFKPLLQKSLPRNGSAFSFSPDEATFVLGPTIRRVTDGSVVSEPWPTGNLLEEFTADGTGIISLKGYLEYPVMLTPRRGGQGRELFRKMQLYATGAISRDGRLMAFHGYDTIEVWDILKGKVVFRKEGFDWSVLNSYNEQISLDSSSVFSADGKSVICFKGPGIRYFDMKSGEIVRSFTAPAVVKSVAESGNGKFCTAVLDDHSVRIWNTATGSSAGMVIRDTGQWVVFNDDGYFDASRDGGDAIRIVSGTDAFGVDQFALRNNRPDLILQAMGNRDAALQEHFRRQYEKRLRKSGLTESALSGELLVPEAFITGHSVQGSLATLNAEFRDTEAELKRYQIYVNDVPVHGPEGRPLQGSHARIAERIALTPGRNKVEASCSNEHGAESYRALVYADCTATSKPDLYYIGFGVSRYRDSELNLRYADKDARDLGAVFSAMKGRYSAVHVRTAVNDEVTVESIRSAREFLKNAKPDDTVVLFIAGHGVHDADAQATYYYLVHGADRNNLAGTCADFSLVEDILQGIAPRNKLFLMDTCDSGEIDPDMLEDIYADAANRKMVPRTTRAISVAPKGGKRTARPYLNARDRYIYNDVQRRTGAIVFSSSRGGEFSYEHDSIRNGYFTKAVIEVLSGSGPKAAGGVISTDELRRRVTEKVAKDTGDKQHPTVDRDNLYQKFTFPVR